MAGLRHGVCVYVCFISVWMHVCLCVRANFYVHVL